MLSKFSHCGYTLEPLKLLFLAAMICMFSVDAFTRQSQHACVLRVWNAGTWDEKKEYVGLWQTWMLAFVAPFDNVYALALRKQFVCKSTWDTDDLVLCGCYQPPLYHNTLVCCMPPTAFDSSTLPLCVFLFSVCLLSVLFLSNPCLSPLTLSPSQSLWALDLQSE